MQGSNKDTASSSSFPTGRGSGSGGWGQRFVQAVQTSVSNAQEASRLKQEAKEVGKVYDKESKEWVFYFLDQELEQVEKLLKESEENNKANNDDDNNNNNNNSSGSDAPGEAERQVADREYYDLLCVSTNADDATIRKAYFKAARKCHPDKNPDDPAAHTKFQALSHAYQVLSHADKRAAYDRDGKSAVTNNNSAAGDMMEGEVDPFVFFNVMFGSTLIEPYVGELWIASTSESVMKDGGKNYNLDDLDDLPPEERDEKIQERFTAMQQKNTLKQRLRQVKCAQNLRKRIAEYDETNPEMFIQSARNEAIKIVNGAYGSLYLNTIGFAMQMAAEEYLGFEKSFFGLAGHLARTRKSASAIGSNFKLLGAGIRAAGAGSRAMQEAEKLQQQQEEKGGGGGGGEESEQKIDERAAQEMMAETLDDSLPAFLELAWAINKRDIQSTLHAVCQKVFNDASVPKETRLVRAKAVMTLGSEFRRVGRAFKQNHKANFHAEDIKARVAVATMTTMAKAQGQEVTEEDQDAMIQQAKMMSTMEPSKAEEWAKKAETETPGATETTHTTAGSPSDKKE